MLVFLTALCAAHAADITVSVSRPGEPAVSCAASNVLRGDLFSGPTLQMGASSVTPLVEVLGLDRSGQVHWRTSLMVVQSGLVLIARPDDRQDPGPCPLGQGCALTFNRAEQTTHLVFSLSGDGLGVAPEERPTWNNSSWFRESRPLSCTSPTPAQPPEPSPSPLPPGPL